jgi:hypothetical protein
MTIETKTIGELIDALISASNGCWHAQDQIADKNLSDKIRLEASMRAQRLNKRRCELVAAIDRRLGEHEDPTTDKTY